MESPEGLLHCITTRVLTFEYIFDTIRVTSEVKSIRFVSLSETKTKINKKTKKEGN